MKRLYSSSFTVLSCMNKSDCFAENDSEDYGKQVVTSMRIDIVIRLTYAAVNFWANIFVSLVRSYFVLVFKSRIFWKYMFKTMSPNGKRKWIRNIGDFIIPIFHCYKCFKTSQINSKWEDLSSNYYIQWIVSKAFIYYTTQRLWRLFPNVLLLIHTSNSIKLRSRSPCN